MVISLAKVDHGGNLPDDEIMKRAMKVMLLVHPQMRPDRANDYGATERDVWRALKRLGHAVEIVPLLDDLKDLDRAMARIGPSVAFNLLEEFRHEGVFDFHAVSYLESVGVPCTGSNPRGLIVSRNKTWAIDIARGAGIRAPVVFNGGGRVRFPAFVKFVREHASRGLTERNRVADGAQLRNVLNSMKQKFDGEISVQEFIAGEDVTVSVYGNSRATVLAPWCLKMNDVNAFATERIKFSAKSRAKRTIRAVRYAGESAERLRAGAAKLYSAFDLSGYARLDFRVTPEGEAYFIDVNANPNLARDEDFARAAKNSGMEYENLIEKILFLARGYRPRV